MVIMKMIVYCYVYLALNHVNIVQHLLFLRASPVLMDIVYWELSANQLVLKPSTKMAHHANHVFLLAEHAHLKLCV